MIRVKLDESNHQQILVDCQKMDSTACYIKIAKRFELDRCGHPRASKFELSTAGSVV